MQPLKILNNVQKARLIQTGMETKPVNRRHVALTFRRNRKVFKEIQKRAARQQQRIQRPAILWLWGNFYEPPITAIRRKRQAFRPEV